MTGQGYYCSGDRCEECELSGCTCACHDWGHTQEQLDELIEALRCELNHTPTP